jgi:hypothetical protein
MDSMRHAFVPVFAGLIFLFAHAPARAQAEPDRGEIRGLKLGLNAKGMPNGFVDFACGSNGGAPRQRLDDWTDFRDCRPESNGLREVYVRFDDEEEYIGKAIDDPLYAGRRSGTRVAGHAVILSVLFDNDGVLRGIRVVSDPRQGLTERRMARLLRLAIINRYDPGGWNCTDFPPAPSESPVAGIFLKQSCDKIVEGRYLSVEVRFLRKPGQYDIDPVMNELTDGQFESWTRFELLDPAFKP